MAWMLVSRVDGVCQKSFVCDGSAFVVVLPHAQADFVMHGSPNNLRIVWQFFEKSFLGRDTFTQPREFAVDQKYFDHFNIRVSPVGTWWLPAPVFMKR